MKTFGGSGKAGWDIRITIGKNGLPLPSMRWRLSAIGLLLAAVALHSPYARARETLPDCGRQLPSYDEYPATLVAAGKRAPLARNSPFARRYRTLLSGALESHPVSLAGQYVVTSFGCGTSCVMYGAVDILSGQAAELTSLMPLGDADKLYTRKDSRLVKAVDFADGYSSPRVARYFEWCDKRLRPVCRSRFDN